MSKICYIPKRFHARNLAIIKKANEILEDFTGRGYELTLRQLYYNFVTINFFPNDEKRYKHLGKVISQARLAGLIDWNHIHDRIRSLNDFYYSDLGTPEDVLEGAASSHEVNNWEDQKVYVECWIEKDTLVNIIERPCNQWRVPYFACRGYNSQSEQWKAGKRLVRQLNNNKKVIILHLGDHDPSGLNMTVDNRDRLNMFVGKEFSEALDLVEVRRLALNMDQVNKYKPPPNPAKEDDARFKKYYAEFGRKCWEMEALDPDVIRKITEDNIKGLINMAQWKRSNEREERERQDFLDAVEKLKKSRR